MYNHPYFKEIIRANETLSSHDVPQPACPIVPNSHYIPKVVDHRNPVWIEDESAMLEVINSFRAVKLCDNDGYTVDNHGFIVNYDGEANIYDGIIHAMVIAPDKNGDVNMADVQIINTENAGFRYVTGKNENMVDAGPVQNVCVVGNRERPEGIYIPTSNLKAVADGIVLMNRFLNNNVAEVGCIPTDNPKPLAEQNPVKNIPGIDIYKEF